MRRKTKTRRKTKNSPASADLPHTRVTLQHDLRLVGTESHADQPEGDREAGIHVTK
jgi:hypothetical protein